MISMTKKTFEALMDTATNRGAKLQFDIGQLQQKLEAAEKENEELKAQMMGSNQAKVPVDKLSKNEPTTGPKV